MAFMCWRQTIALHAGYCVWKVETTDMGMMDTIILDWGHLPEGYLHGEWLDLPADPLVALFVHADDEGYLLPQHCIPIADRLQELLPALAKIPDHPGHIGNWVVKTEIFISALRKASIMGERVNFR